MDAQFVGRSLPRSARHGSGDDGSRRVLQLGPRGAQGAGEGAGWRGSWGAAFVGAGGHGKSPSMSSMRIKIVL